MAQPKSLTESTVREVALAVRDRLGWPEALTQSFETLKIAGTRIVRMDEEGLTILCASKSPEHLAAVGCLMAFKAAGHLPAPAPAPGQMVGFDSAAGDAPVMGSSSAPSVVFISGAVGDYSACVNGGYDRTSETSYGFPVYSKRGDESMFIEKSGDSWGIKDLSDKGSNYFCAIIEGGLNARACIRIWNYRTFVYQSKAKMLTGQEAERAVSRLVFNNWHGNQSPKHPIKPRMQQYCCLLVFA